MNKRILLYVLLLVGLSLAFERPKLDLSGMIMVHAYADWNTDESNVVHRYESMLDLDFDVRFHDRWSAWLEIEAMGMAMDGMEEMEGMDMGDDATMDPVYPTVVFNGAYVQYAPSEHLAFRIGDLNYFGCSTIFIESGMSLLSGLRSVSLLRATVKSVRPVKQTPPRHAVESSSTTKPTLRIHSSGLLSEFAMNAS